jgi:hypothetical protein
VTDHDTFRWGDVENLLIVKATGENTLFTSRQLLNARWQRPCVWRLLLSYNPQFSQSSLTYSIGTLLVLGIGQTTAQIPLNVINVATPFAPTVLFFDIPAETIIVQFALFSVGGAVPANDSIQLTAMAAPHAEPGAVVQMRDGLGAPRHGVESPDSEGLPHWMGPGFEDGELRYRTDPYARGGRR